MKENYFLGRGAARVRWSGGASSGRVHLPVYKADDNVREEEMYISVCGTWGGSHIDIVHVYVCACLLRYFFMKFGIAIGRFFLEMKELGVF